MADDKAQDEVEGLGDEGEPAEIDERIERRPVRFAVRARGVNGLEQIGRLGAGEKAQMRGAAGVANGEAEYVYGRLLAVRIAGIAGKIDCVVQGDDGGAIGRRGQEGRGEVLIHDGGVLIRLIEGVVAADFGRGLRIRFAVDGPGKEGWSPRLRRHHARLLQLLHVAQAGGPLDQRAQRSAIARHLGFDVDDIAGIEAEGLDGVDAVGRVVECNRGGRKDEAGGRGLRAVVVHLIQRIIKFGGERRLVGEERERQSEAGGASACTRSSGLPVESKYFFRVQLFTCAPRLVKTIL